MTYILFLTTTRPFAIPQDDISADQVCQGKQAYDPGVPPHLLPITDGDTIKLEELVTT